MSRKHITVYRVRAGAISRLYYTLHHAEQMARALSLRGLDTAIDVLRVPDDALTRLTVQS